MAALHLARPALTACVLLFGPKRASLCAIVSWTGLHRLAALPAFALLGPKGLHGARNKARTQRVPRRACRPCSSTNVLAGNNDPFATAASFNPCMALKNDISPAWRHFAQSAQTQARHGRRCAQRTSGDPVADSIAHQVELTKHTILRIKIITSTSNFLQLCVG
jgi:hypothetical protein